MQALDPEQLELSRTAVVEASAGTGKTYTITSLFLRLLLERGLGVEQILVVTYTRAATAELRDRIRKRLALALTTARGESRDDPLLVRLCESTAARIGSEAMCERLERALAGVDEAPVLTIHGFCQRVLRDHAFESGSAFETKLTTHAAPLLDEIADDYFIRELYETAPLRAEILLSEPPFLRKLAARVSGRSIRILPEHAEEREIDGAGFQHALERCRTLWKSERARVTEHVRTLRGIGQKALQFADVAEQLLASGDPALLLDKTSFRNFTLSGVQEKAKGTPPSHPFFDAAEQLLARARAFVEGRTSVTLAFRRRFVDYLEHELERRTREQSVRTFDALLVDLDRALQGAQGGTLTERLRGSYRAALVDEFQDTDPLQYRIFRTIFAGSDAPLLLIGDPKQAIYGFRGADVAAYLKARQEAGERVYTLDHNYRSDPALLASLNALYGGVERPFLLEEIRYQPVRAPDPRLVRFRADDGRAPLDLALVSSDDGGNADALRRSVARHVACDIAALLASGATRSEGGTFVSLAARDIAVLCRTNQEAALVQTALSERGVPSVLSGDASVFDSDDVAQLERALTAMAHPGDARALRSFLASSYGGYDASAIASLEEDDARWELHRARFQKLHETWLALGFMQALRALVATYEVEQRLLARVDGTRRITNLWHLGELLTEVAMSERLGPLGLLRWLALVQGDETLRSELAGDAHELRLESGDDAVKLTTVHKSKGLEYPVVYCPFAWTAAELFKAEKELVRFHDGERDHALTLDLGTPERAQHEEIAREETLAEALRLLYVALTRAKHRVTVLVPTSDKFAQSALGYTLFGGGDAAARKSELTALVKDGALGAALDARATALKQAFSLRTLALQATRRYAVPGAHATEIVARPVRRTLDHLHRVGSFSALVARERTTFSEAGLDRDASEGENRSDRDEAPSPLPLGAFPRGSVAGQLVHEVLEHCEFDGTREALSHVVERHVLRRGYPADLVPSLTHGLASALEAPLDDSGLALAQLSRRDRVDEMEFVFPVDSLLTPRVLERIFRAHKAPSTLTTYASELGELGFDALHGYLRGYIDLVFRHDARFYVVDYKSNWLGPIPDDYAPAKLPRAMADHHYFLQYHLYTVAVHRFLAQRVPGYTYATHFGGVYYLFLRGMAKEHALGTGVFFDRPSEPLIGALDAALRGAPERSDEEEVSP